MTDKDKEYERRQAYCRRLGHPVPFAYCRRVSGGLPCSAVLDCWFETFPVWEFIRGHYSPQELGQMFTTPASKLSVIVEALEKVRSAGGSG